MEARSMGSQYCLEQIKQHQLNTIRVLQSEVFRLKLELKFLRAENSMMKEVTNRQKVDVRLMHETEKVIGDTRAEADEWREKAAQEEKEFNRITAECSKTWMKQLHMENKISRLQELADNPALYKVDESSTRKRIAELEEEENEKDKEVTVLQKKLKQAKRKFNKKYKKLSHNQHLAEKEVASMTLANRHLRELIKLTDLEASNQSMHHRTRLPALAAPDKKKAIEWKQEEDDRISKWLKALNI